MPRHPALQSIVSLRRTYVAFAKGERHVIGTVGEALRFLVRLPRKLDGLHWTLASVGLCWAHKHPESGTGFATEAFEFALISDNLLEEIYAAA
jgi:hypothetical protein